MTNGKAWMRLAMACAASATAPGMSVAAPTDRWPDFQIIVWQPQTPAAYATLKTLGVTAGAVIANRDTPEADLPARAPLRAAGMGWYIENIATDFYAPYHRYVPGQAVNAQFLAAQQRWRADPSDPRAFFRSPSLSDPAWLARISARMQATIRAHAADPPLFYDLGDETGIADLTAAWDFDRSPMALAAMRVWLQARYPSLAALNAQWGTDFTSWGDVLPMTTRQALARQDRNYSAWGDFKAWMDAAFARALRVGTEAVHEADPAALSAIEGAQRPGMGGYDYSHLANAVDVMEIYPDDTNLDLVQSINPTLVTLTTTAGEEPDWRRSVWQAVLRGSKGLVLWDGASDIVSPDGAIGPRGRAMAPLLRELHGPAVAALLAAEPVYDDIAILYSPASDRLGWLLDRVGTGDAWARRDAEIENQDNSIRASRRTLSAALQHRGLRAKWITPEQLEQGGLRGAARILLLPQTIALSDATVTAIKRFSEAGGVVFADGIPGLFDEHGRSRAQQPLAGIVPAARIPDDWFARFAAVGVTPSVTIVTDGGDVALWIWRRGDARFIAVMHDAQAARVGDSPADVELDLGRLCHVTDLRSGEDLLLTRRVRIRANHDEPSILKISYQD